MRFRERRRRSAWSDSLRRRDRAQRTTELRQSLRVGLMLAGPVLLATGALLAVRFPARGAELFGLWAAEALALGIVVAMARRVRGRWIVRLTVLFSTIPAIGLPVTLAMEPGTFLMMSSGFSILPVAVPLFLAWDRGLRTRWLITYAAVFGTITLLTGFGSLNVADRIDFAVDTTIGCFIGWIGGELLERLRATSLKQQVELRRLNRVLHSLATTDPLTGLANRRRLDADLDRLTASLQDSDIPCALVMLDLDRFKRLNDELGHAAGDAALLSVADELKRQVRGEDTVYRYGGEEFLVVLPETTLEAGVEVAERIREAISGLAIHVQAGRRQTALTISGGVAVSGRPHHAWNAALAAADAALYEAKAGGRDRICAVRIGTALPATG